AIAAADMINPQPIGLTGDNSDQMSSDGLNIDNAPKTDILSLLGTTPDVKKDTLSLLAANQPQNAKPEVGQDSLPQTAMNQALLNLGAADDIANKEMLALAMKSLNARTPGNDPQDIKPQDISPADLIAAHRSKHDFLAKDAANSLVDGFRDAKPADAEIDFADSNGSQSSKQNFSKDTADSIKELIAKAGGSKQDDSANSSAFTVDKTQQSFHEVVGKTAHTEAPATATDEKLAVGGSKTIDLDGNKFTIMRKSETSISVKLEPDGIGKLDISVNVNKGVLNANISAADATAKGIIEKNLHEIVNALAKEGLTVGGFTVSLKDRGGNFNDGKNENGDSSGKTPKEQRQIQPAAVTGYAKPGYSINDGISIFA
ncbi:MAG: flagellar hook-length control protein FliK, partial [Candidatus Magnetominusculus sp. LBB02]|nr:flagellar hook-length control protein FliK [Candidatus Magnetominusculus sp. LBB02]